MKITTLRAVIIFGIFLLPLSQLMAFEDIYEPDDTFEQANNIVVQSNIRQQHTLHSQDDEDWFRFYASTEVKRGYEIQVYNVGSHIDVAIELYDSDGTTLLRKVNRDFEGGKEFLTFEDVPKTGFYYFKVRDSFEGKMEDCRINIQYELKIEPGLAVNPPESKASFVTDVLSGNPIPNAKVRLCGREYETTEKGEYFIDMSCPTSTFAITVEALGYQPLTCHIPIVQGSTDVTKNIALIPEGQTIPIERIIINPDDKLVPSKTVYRKSDTLRVEFPLFPIPAEKCVRYYLGLQYPDGNISIIKEFNQLEPLNPSFLPHWSGTGHNNDDGKTQIVLEQPISDMPSGQYLLYLLRISGYVNDVINNLDLGELNATPFEIK